MAFHSLSEFIHLLEKEGELVRIKHFTDPVLEIAEVTDRISKQPGGGMALLFENNGTGFPVLINAFGSEKRMCLALDVKDLDETGRRIESLLANFTTQRHDLFEKMKLLSTLSHISSFIPKKSAGRGKCQEVIMAEPDISIFPVLQCWPYDGGRFVTLPMVITKNPVTGMRNVGMYRMHIFGKNITGMHWHRHKTGAAHFEEYKKSGKIMPVAVALGGDPVLTYSATAPLPANIDEFLFAGFLRKRRVELVKCITQDIDVPAEADIIIEGYIDPSEEFIMEGPFGDHTGFYSPPDMYPKFHITCITHRKMAVYPATIVGNPPQEDAYIAKATERIFLTPIRIALLPELTDIDIPPEGASHNMTIVKFRKSYPGHAIKVMNALWGAGQMMLNKIMVTVSDEADIHNYPILIRNILSSFDPATDVTISRGPLDVLDHSSSAFSFGGKLGIDATKKFPEEETPVSTTCATNVSIEIAGKLKIKYPVVSDINLSLLMEGYPLLIISVKKQEGTDIKKLAEEILREAGNRKLKLVVFTDHEADIYDYRMTVWYVTNNIDPARDCFLVRSPSGSSILAIDGTRKIMKSDNFHRPWPNVIISNDETVRGVDSKWDKLGLGKFIISPSLKYKPLVPNEGAVLKQTDTHRAEF
jgi:4-hydroxy-3-polyprenylbenzoate decarboxylase